MRVTMRTNITGYRNGEPWPAPGESIDVPDNEGHGLIANGYAEEATDEGSPEHDDPAPDGDGDEEAGPDDGADTADEPSAAPAAPAEPVADDPAPAVDEATTAKRTTRARSAKPKS